MRDKIAAKILRRRRYCPWCPIAKLFAKGASRIMNAKALDARRAKTRFAEISMWATANAIVGTPGFSTPVIPALPKTRKAQRILWSVVYAA